jgi:hypothetical protein
MEKHVNIVAALQIVNSVLGLFFALLIFTILSVVGSFIDEPDASLILDLIARILAVMFIILALPGIIAGVGLIKRKEWARILTLIISIFQFFNFPIGTAIGIYSIWALVQPENVALFQNKPANLSSPS